MGLAVLTWGLSSSLTSVLTGRISTISTRTLLAIPVALCQVALYLFLLLWPREPSHAVVFVASFLAGITDGLWMTLSSSEYMCIILGKYPNSLNVYILWICTVI